jgi:hypothetical protein
MRLISNRLVQLAACAAFVAAGVPAAAAPVTAAAVTVKGEVVDAACFKKNAANKGAKMALVTADGQVYTIAGDYTANKNEKLIPMIAGMVEATGEVAEKDGEKTLTVTAMKKAS